MPSNALPRASRALDIRHLVVEEVENSRTNGVHHVADYLAREQRRMGDAAEIVLLHEPGRSLDTAHWAAPVRTVPLVGRRLLGRIVQPGPGILDALAEGAGDGTLVHVHGTRRPMLPALGYALVRRGLRYLVTVHGRYAHVFDGDRPVRPAVALYLRTFERRFLEEAAFVHALNEPEAATIRRIAPRARIEIVGNAAYSSAFDGIPAWPARAGPSAAYPAFGFCGRYAITHKGLDLLIEGFARHRAAGGAGRLALAGTGAAGTEAATLAALTERLGAGDGVAIGGPVFGRDKIRTLHSWDYFVQASRFDGQPVGALEAALNGLPLIVSRATGLGEAVERSGAGFVIESGTAEGVAEALARAARVPAEAWPAMSRAAHALALEIGDWTRSAQRLRDLCTHPWSGGAAGRADTARGALLRARAPDRAPAKPV